MIDFGLILQDKRISVTDALAHPYLDEGRLRYHSCMCKCCFTTSAGMRQYVVDFEPTAPQPFDDYWERKMTSVQQVKGKSVWSSIRKSKWLQRWMALAVAVLQLKCLFSLYWSLMFFPIYICRGNAQIHCGTTANGTSAVVYKSTECRVQEFRQVRNT